MPAARRTPKPTAVTALDSAVAELPDKDGNTKSYMIVRGKTYAANHPMVLHAPELFDDAEPLDYETATSQRK